ncbi:MULTISPECIES: phage minor tail protein L [Cronobacter]|uniref:phage minor tail protein L n=1 Tax=Cronobacter TaxID=413496 RepID=UPI001412DDDE|nr:MULTISPECIES: phage minor tail protein L [Cronobacter]ELY3463219.1 phage minor tail protein L [Cronobacter sakazakii]NHV16975.1 phage minor tail protein L [Cronobacter sakazakii]NHV37409.1 phage minor tail protein L [Cronobacter sakazakii]NHV47542.1 phage minor tail protein L [Cronobacter sakazakii]NHW30443.1 phage minor tail protein L [Cronobacter sakazakii]
MAISNDVQKLEPGDSVRLVTVDGSAFGAGVLRFHACTIPHSPEEIAASGGDTSKLAAKSIWFDGEEYGAWPFEITGLASSSDGQSAEPVLRVANLDGVVTALCLRFDDMVQAKVTVLDTFGQYLDARTFPDGNPSADPGQYFRQVFYIDSKAAEDNEVVEFRLSSPMDLQGLLIPTRQITAVCTWACRNKYRSGDGCTYNGPRMFDLKGNPVTDPAQDKCSGLLTDCKKRFGSDARLDFGGFPGASLIRR